MSQIKFAKCGYNSFRMKEGALLLHDGQIFVVTPEIEKSVGFQEGIKTGNFTFIEPQLHEMRNAVGITEAIIAQFTQPTNEVPKETPVATPVETPVEPMVEQPPEDPAPENEVISFTEVAGSVKNALEAIKTETDVDKLNFALAQDERKSIKKAINDRLKELQE